VEARIRAARERRGWSQGELAARAGVTRQLVGAVETGRHAPNVNAALGLAAALGLSVEELFAQDDDAVRPVLDEPLAPGTPVMTARVGDRLVAVPLASGVESSESWGMADAVAGGDGNATDGDAGLVWLPGGGTTGLVLAGCDPVLGLIGSLAEQTSAHRSANRPANRVVAVHASTGRSIAALADGRVHGVLVHARAGEFPAPPVGVRRWHVARWQVGLAARARTGGRGGTRGGPPTVEELVSRHAPVVQRDAGAGSQRAFLRALSAAGAGPDMPGPVAEGHVDVARRVAQGTGRAGVTMEAAALAFGLAFTPLEEHDVELWVDERWASTTGVMAVLDVLSSPALARRAAVLGGYDLDGCGAELHRAS
jgi:DNA-binding XRE family transcriptional regulator/molybdate-binding protein